MKKIDMKCKTLANFVSNNKIATKSDNKYKSGPKIKIENNPTHQYSKNEQIYLNITDNCINIASCEKCSYCKQTKNERLNRDAKKWRNSWLDNYTNFTELEKFHCNLNGNLKHIIHENRAELENYLLKAGFTHEGFTTWKKSTIYRKLKNEKIQRSRILLSKE